MRWKPVVGYESLYSVSSDGRVKSFHKGRVKILKQGYTSHGYPMVVLVKNGKKKSWQIHTLVLNAFRGCAKNRQECLHLDNNPKNNTLSNLKWGSRQDNVDQKVRDGRSLCGEQHGGAKYSNDLIKTIKEWYDAGVPVRKLSERYGISCPYLYLIVNGKVRKVC